MNGNMVMSYRKLKLKTICHILIIGIFSPFILSACSQDKPDTVAEKPVEFKEIQWTDLMPLDDLQALMEPPEEVNQIADGSPEDVQSQSLDSDFSSQFPESKYQQALTSRNVVDTMNGKAIKLPGFIVPLEFGKDQKITQFFLVPYFGACIHMPPPPPNQIILVDVPEGIEQTELYDPFWVSGIVRTTITERELGTSAYSLEMHKIEPYTEEE